MDETNRRCDWTQSVHRRRDVTRGHLPTVPLLLRHLHHCCACPVELGHAAVAIRKSPVIQQPALPTWCVCMRSLPPSDLTSAVPSAFHIPARLLVASIDATPDRLIFLQNPLPVRTTIPHVINVIKRYHLLLHIAFLSRVA